MYRWRKREKHHFYKKKKRIHHGGRSGAPRGTRNACCASRATLRPAKEDAQKHFSFALRFAARMPSAELICLFSRP
jgi:hypothetical protein